MKKYLSILAVASISTVALAAVWIQNPVEQYTTQAKEEILAPVKAKKNFSGLTYVPETKSFYGIINRGDRMFEFDENFNLKREITISGFDDPEDLAFVKMTEAGPLLAISEEPGHILLGFMPAGNQLKASSMKTIRLVDEAGRALEFNDNKGLEGITYIPQEERFVIVKEKNPMKFWTFSLADAQTLSTVKVKNFLPTETEDMIKDMVTDLSAVSWHATSKSIAFLSDESSKIIYVDNATKEVSKVVTIKTKLQHEGLTFSADYQTTYVASEPYYLIRINKTNTLQNPSL